MIFSRSRGASDAKSWSGGGSLLRICKGGHLRLALKRAAASAHLIEERAEAEDVGTVVDSFPLGLLGRHVSHGSKNRAFFCARAFLHSHGGAKFVSSARLGKLSQAEVEHLHVAVCGHHD